MNELEKIENELNENLIGQIYDKNLIDAVCKQYSTDKYVISCDPALGDNMTINLFVKKKAYLKNIIWDDENPESKRRRLIRENKQVRKEKIEKLWKLKN